MIVEVLPRTTEVVRRAAGKQRLKQVIVANADQVVPVMAAAQPRLVWELLDRYLAVAEEAGLGACIVITKIDLIDPSTIHEEVEVYRRLGYPVVLTSTITGEGIEEASHHLKDRVSVLAGKSGAGKSSLLNAIQPDLGLRVSAVSASTNKGKHTTTHLEMFPLEIGGAIVDTPGMREFGLWDDSSKRQRLEHEDMDLAELFVELRPHIGRCRFGLDCTHVHEPGCAVKEAVERGEVTERRYRSYLRMAEG
jgi:ribosome biogenesis GTPase